MEKLSQLLFRKKAKSKKDFLEELYKQYGARLCSYGMHSWKLTEDEAWDLTYKTLYRILDVFPKYDFQDSSKFQSFLFTTHINYIKNHFRDHKTQLEHVHVDLHENISGENQGEDAAIILENTKLKALQEVLEELEDWQRILVLMRTDGRSYSEIAAFVDKPENQLKVYYQRIKERIIKKINEH